MNFFNKVLDTMGFKENEPDQNDGYYYDDDNQNDYVEEAEYEAVQPKSRFSSLPRLTERNDISSNHYDGQGSESARIVLMQPLRFDQAQTIVRNLLEGRIVVFDLQSCSMEDALNIVNFVSGAIFAIDGRIEKINERGVIFICLPPDVGLDNELQASLESQDYGPTIADWVNTTRSKDELQ